MEKRITIKPKTNIFNHPKGVTIQLFMPRLIQNKVSVALEEEQRLVIRGKNKLPMDIVPLKSEMNHGIYHREFSVSENYDTDQIQATYKNGILSVDIPLKKDTGRTIPIN